MLTSGIKLALKVGSTVAEAAPQSLADALQSVEVTCSDETPSGFQLQFRAERSATSIADYSLLASKLLAPLNRVGLVVAIGDSSTVLIDGFVTHQQLQWAPDGGLLTVTGEDVSIFMDRIEKSFEFPFIPDVGVVRLVLGLYELPPLRLQVKMGGSLGRQILDALLGTPPQQNGTDRCFLQELAAKYAYRFYVEPGDTYGQNTAYWGPPVMTGQPQKALSVNLGPETNVNSIDFQYDATVATLANGFVQPPTPLPLVPVPVTTSDSTRPALAKDSGLLGVTDAWAKRSLFDHQGLNLAQALVRAQAITDASTDNVLTATGELDVFRYGTLLRSRRLVNLRGAGERYDGTYYVKSVTHRLDQSQYTQQFTLTRAGLGSTISEV